jgi:glucose/arabinose dehydrogenase
MGMMSRAGGAVFLASALLANACGPDAEPTRPSTTEASPLPTPSPSPEESPFLLDQLKVSLSPFISGVESPLFLTHAGDGSGRVYIVGQTGRISIAEAGGELLPEPFLDISDRVVAGGEQGLLGLAFHPSYSDTGRFYVNYTDENGDTVIAEYRRVGERRADPASERVLFRIDQPYPNHNGGMLAFGPDGFLYIGMGDGGSGGDPHDNGQRLDTLLGKLLRIDVDRGKPYGVPPDNPFVDDQGSRAEIWAFGLRNPWRFSFDRETGDLFIGDVGQNDFEEIDLLPAGTPAGANLGWRIMEASRCFASDDCKAEGLVLPLAEYPTTEGCAVTGGYVYRGTRFPALRGGYLYSDFCGGQIWGLSASEARSGAAKSRLLLQTELNIASFGEDEEGELYVTDLTGGAVYQVRAA